MRRRSTRCPFRVPASTGASCGSRRASVRMPETQASCLDTFTNVQTNNERHGPRSAPWRRVRWREHIDGVADKCTSGDAGADRGRGPARGGGACSSWRSSVSRARRVWHLLGNPRYLMPAPPVVGAEDLPAPRSEPARIPAPEPCAPEPASAPGPGPAETRPTSDTSRHLHKSEKLVTAKLPFPSLPARPPQVYRDTACQLVTEPSRPIRRPDKYLRLETGGGSDFAVIWP